MEARLGRRRPAIDISWVSCRGVRSSLPFHTPCLYASIFVVWSSSVSRNAHGPRRHHRVKTPTDRAGGENPEWDAPLRLYLPASPPPVAADGENRNDGRRRSDDDSGGSTDDDVLLLKFEVKAEVAVLGDVHSASAAVPVPDLVADGRTRRVSYQLVGPDGRQPNGVVSFSYAFQDHERNDDDDGQSSSSSSDGGSEPATPPFCTNPSAASTAVALPQPTITTAAAAPRLYPEIEWTLAEQPLVYPPVTVKNFTVADTQYYSPPPPPAPPVQPSSIYPPARPTEPASSVYPPVTVTEKSLCSMYPTVAEPGGALYPTLDLVAPGSHYPPPPAYGVAWGDRCLYG